LEALITEREGMLAANRERQRNDYADAYGPDAFMELAGRIRALVPTKKNPKGDEGS
jgi:hypothetical protein